MIEPDVRLITGLLHSCPERGIGCHAAGNSQLVIAIFFCSENCTAYQSLHHCILERCHQIRHPDLFAGHMGFINVIQHSRLQAAEAEIIW